MPKKPSVGALPTPSATTAGANSSYGQASYARNTTGQGGYGTAPTGSGATGYQTGPYNTGSATGYPAPSPGLAGSPSASPTGPYSSPYQAAQTGTTNYNTGTSYGTADARNASGYQGSSTSGSTAQPWSSDPYRQTADPYGAGQTSTSPYGGTSPTNSGGSTSTNGSSMSYPQTQNPYPSGSGGYDTSSTNGYQQPASYQQPQGSSATATHAFASDNGQSGYPATSPSSYQATAGGYRPGSTGRDTGALPSSTSTASPNGYPTSGGPAATTANQPWSYGAEGQYPTTGQY